MRKDSLERQSAADMTQDEKKMKVKKGWLAVRVGLDDEEGGFKRFEIPISYLYHPLFKQLLEKAYEVYEYRTKGPLRLPCSVDDFLGLQRRIERANTHQFLHQNHPHYLSTSLPFTAF